MKHKLTMVVLATLAGCASYDLSINASFEPVPDGFRYRNIADKIYPPNSREAELKRYDRLNQFLAETGQCPNGYLIRSRTPVRKTRGGIYDIFYVGVCT